MPPVPAATVMVSPASAVLRIVNSKAEPTIAPCTAAARSAAVGRVSVRLLLVVIPQDEPAENLVDGVE